MSCGIEESRNTAKKITYFRKRTLTGIILRLYFFLISPLVFFLHYPATKPLHTDMHVSVCLCLIHVHESISHMLYKPSSSVLLSTYNLDKQLLLLMLNSR